MPFLSRNRPGRASAGSKMPFLSHNHPRIGTAAGKTQRIGPAGRAESPLRLSAAAKRCASLCAAVMPGKQVSLSQRTWHSTITKPWTYGIENAFSEPQRPGKSPDGIENAISEPQPPRKSPGGIENAISEPQRPGKSLGGIENAISEPQSSENRHGCGKNPKDRTGRARGEPPKALRRGQTLRLAMRGGDAGQAG